MKIAFVKTVLLLITLALSAPAQTSSRITLSPQGSDTGELRFEEKRVNGTNFVSLSAPVNVPDSLRLRLPSDAGEPGYCIKTDGLGNLKFAPCSEVNSLDYVWTRSVADGQISGDLSSSGSGKVIDFAVCPEGLAKGVEFRITGSGTNETVRITATTCFTASVGTTAGAGTVTVTTAYAHPGSYVVSTATNGIGEAAAAASLGWRQPARVRVPAGTHNIYGQVYVPEGGLGPAKGIVIRGDGAETTIVKQNNPITPFRFEYGQGNEIRSLKVTFGDDITNAHTSVWAVEMRGQSRPRVEDLFIEWAPNGILVGDSTLQLLVPPEYTTLYRNVFPSASAQIHNITFRSVLTGGVGIKITSTYPVDPLDPLTGTGDSRPATTARDGGDDYFITGISIYGISRFGGAPERPSACIEIQAGGGVNITGKNAIANCDQALLVNPTNYQNVRWMFVSDTALDTSGYGLVFHPQTGGVIQSFASGSNLWVATNTYDGIVTLGAGEGGFIKGIEIGPGARIANNGQRGIHHLYGSDFRTTGIHVCGNSIADPGEYDGVVVGAGVSDFSFDDLTSGNCDGFNTPTQRYGIHIAPGGGSNDRYRVTGQFNGNLTGSLIDGGTGMSKIIQAVKPENYAGIYVAGDYVDFGYGVPNVIEFSGATPIKWLGTTSAHVRNPIGTGHVLYVRFRDANPGGFIEGGNILPGRLIPKQHALVTCVMQEETNWFCSAYTERFPILTIETPADSPAVNSFNLWDRDHVNVFVMATIPPTELDPSERIQIGYYDTTPEEAAPWKEVFIPGKLRTWEFLASRGDFYPGDGFDGLRIFNTAQTNYFAVKPHIGPSTGSIGYYLTGSSVYGRVRLEGTLETANFEVMQTDTTHEGGNIYLYGANVGFPNWTIDLYDNELRLFNTGTGTTDKVSIYNGSSVGVTLNVVGPIVGSKDLTITDSGNFGGDVIAGGGLAVTGSSILYGGLTVQGGFSCSGTGCPAATGGVVAFTAAVRNAAGTGSCTIEFNAAGMRVGGTC